MKIFITGGTGFVGKHTVKALKKQGHRLMLLSRNNKNHNTAGVKFIKGNLNKVRDWKQEVLRFSPNIVIHLAWEGLPDHHVNISKNNLEWSLNLVQLASEAKCRLFVATGSGWEYGIQHGKLSENTSPNPFDAYTAAKHSVNTFGWEIAKENNMSFVWLRPFFIYGPGQRSLALIPSLLSSIKRGKKPEIRNPNAKNDFVYVGDVAEAIALVIKKCFPQNGADPKHYVYNVGSGKLTGVADIVKYICLKYNLKINYKKTAKQPQDKITTSCANITKIRKEIGWKPKTSIQKGITLTIKDFN